MSERNDVYADALLAVLVAEGASAEVEDELFRLGRAVEGNDELREALADPRIPAARRQQIVEDLLAGKAEPLTVAIAGLVVGAGRARDLPAIVDRLVERRSAQRSASVAEVRSAVDLSADQKARLAAALSKAVGQQVEVKVVVDPTVVGGAVAQIGDQVIDGSIRTRLAQLREAF
jgi:F-type H+-transporting ATPase subunit delta